jgi:D-inositol-3-phosphate glycosyltransferase
MEALMADGVVFRDLPIRVEAEKDGAPERTAVYGAPLSSSDLIASFLRYGTWDRYSVLIPSPDAEPRYRERLAAYPNGDRVVFVPFGNWTSLQTWPRLVLFSHTSRLFESAHIRNCVGSPQWVASAMTHALSFQVGLLYCLYMNLQHLYAHDSLICTSRAGRTAVGKLLALTGEGLSANGWPAAAPSFQLPLIPLGVDPERFHPRDRYEARSALGLPAEACVFLYLGRFSSAGKMDLNPLLLAFKAAFPDDQHQNLLILAGDDTDEKNADRLRGFAGELGIGAHVTIWPNPTSAQKDNLYAAADVFTSLCDNLQETFGLTILEAMSSGLPVVASDWSGYRDMVQHGQTGRLIPTYWTDCTDDISELVMLRGDGDTHWLLGQSVAVDIPAAAEAFRELASQPDLRREMGANGRARVLDRFSWRTVVGQYEELWHESLNLAEAKPRSGSGERYGVNAYRHFDAFQHFASQLLNGHTTLRITSSGETCADAGTLPSALDRDRLGLRPALLLALLARLRAGVSVPFKDILTRASAELEESDAVVSRHLLRLVKYGLVRVDQAGTPA